MGYKLRTMPGIEFMALVAGGATTCSALRRSAGSRPGLDATAGSHRWRNPFLLHSAITPKGRRAPYAT
jgi:hypothetical protein